MVCCDEEGSLLMRCTRFVRKKICTFKFIDFLYDRGNEVNTVSGLDEVACKFRDPLLVELFSRTNTAESKGATVDHRAEYVSRVVRGGWEVMGGVCRFSVQICFNFIIHDTERKVKERGGLSWVGAGKFDGVVCIVNVCKEFLDRF